MMPPSPMEPMEFREVCRWDSEPKCPPWKEKEGGEDQGPSQSSDEHVSQRGEGEVGSSSLPSPLSMENICIRVPVVRVFGPVLRGGDYDEFINNTNQSSCCNTQGSSQFPENTRSSSRKQRIQQPQSGCLHIHGAFPYMLARPSIAGPDGSMHHGYNCDILSGRIDWDDANSVSNILEEIHCRLEIALRASYEHHNVGTNANIVIPGAAVVTGAKNSCDDRVESRQQTPLFIRQVTIVVGRGFYTYCSGPPAPFLRVEYYDPSMRWRVKMILERGIELNDLYHPDPNQYDHVDIDETNQEFDRDGDIRPLKFRCYEAHIPYTMQFFKDCNLAGMKYIKVGQARFRDPLPRSLRKRTKEEFSTADHANCTEKNTLNDNSFFFSHTVPGHLLWPQLNDTSPESKTKSNEHWLKKQTSCDLECDCTVQQLLNVFDVMTALPSLLEERQKIHWRAVPSLREIWEQERKRMSTLVPPENDFLSCMEKKEEAADSEESSDDDADEEINQLDNNEESKYPHFTLNVKKGASVPGTRLAIKGIKRLFGTSVGLEADFRRALKDIVSRHRSYINDVDKSMERVRDQVHNPNCIVNTTSNCVFTPDLDEGIEALAALGDQFSQGSAVFDVDDDLEAGSPNNYNRSLDFGTPIASKLNTMRNYNATPLSQKDADEEIEMLTFGNRVDDGDTTDESDEDDDDFLVEEERMGEAGLEKALTQLATQAMEPNVESAVAFCNDAEDLKFEKDYGYAHLSGEDVKGELYSDDEGDYDAQLEVYTKDFEESQGSKDRSRLSNLSRSSEVSSSNNGTGGFIVEGYNTTPESIQESGGGLSQKHNMIFELPTSDFVVEPHQSTTLRCGEIIKQCIQSNSISGHWHALPSANFEACPPWFAFQWNSPGAPPAITIPCSFLEPVKRPPSYSQVRSWVRDQRKRTAPHTKHNDQLFKQQKYAATQRSGNIEENADDKNRDSSFLTAYTQYSQLEGSTYGTPDPLAGLGHQGGLVQISAGGGLKTQINTSTTFTPLTIMSIEIHVQCRISTKDQKDIAMVPVFSRDAVFAVVYVYCRDPGGGESLEILEKGCVLVVIEPKGHSSSSTPTINTFNARLGASLDASVEIVKTETNLLLRIASIVKQKDPDVLVSWDTQGEGIGFLVERGVAISTPSSTPIDMARLLGRTPKLVVPDVAAKDTTSFDTFGGVEGEQPQTEDGHRWSGSGLGAEWDDRVGSGAAASSIVSHHVMLCEMSPFYCVCN